MREFIVESLGWIGVVMVLVAYALLSFEVLAADSILFQSMNLIGALVIGVDAYFDKNYQPVVLNAVWFGIAALALANILNIV